MTNEALRGTHEIASEETRGVADFPCKSIGGRGFSLVEVLVTLVIIVVASLSTLGYFASGLSGIGKQANQRAALEIARGRMDQLYAGNLTSLQPPTNSTAVYYLICSGTPCSWTRSLVATSESVTVNGVAGRQLQTTVQWRDEPATNGTNADVLEFRVRAWFASGTGDDEFSRVELRSLRAP